MSMTIKQHVDHWLNSSNESLRTMEVLLKNDRRMDAMYFGHLSVEKAFKALAAAQNSKIIFEHNLVTLANHCGIVLTDDMQLELQAINEFNTKARYASNKSRIYSLCTPKYVSAWAVIIRKWQKLLKKQVAQLRAALPNNTPAQFPVNEY